MHASPTKHEHTIPFWLYISAFYVVKKKIRKKEEEEQDLPLSSPAASKHKWHTTPHFGRQRRAKPTDKC
jgi:hypothetical protein